MRQGRPGASIVAMPAAEPQTEEPMVLVAYANFAVASALAQRLMECCIVSLVPAGFAATGLRRHAGNDVVVLSPSLERGARPRFLELCAEQDPPPAVLEVCDEP